MRRSQGSRLAVSASVITGAVAFGPAVAQDAARADDQLQEVVVTGSLIQRGGNNAAVSPIVTVSEDAIKRERRRHRGRCAQSAAGFHRWR